MAEKPDWSWWTEQHNDVVLRYLDKQLDVAVKNRKKLRSAAIHCTRCLATVVEVIPLKLPDPAGTLVHAIKFRKISQLSVDVDVPENAPPGEFGRAMAAAIAARNTENPSYRIGPWEPDYRLDGEDLSRSLTTVAHDCKNPEGKAFAHECLLPTQSILDRAITMIDPWPPDWASGDTP